MMEVVQSTELPVARNLVSRCGQLVLVSSAVCNMTSEQDQSTVCRIFNWSGPKFSVLMADVKSEIQGRTLWCNESS